MLWRFNAVLIAALLIAGICFQVRSLALPPYLRTLLTSDGVERVSLIRVLADSDKYDGQRLQVAGFFVHEEENHALYLSPDDATNGVSNGGIELIFAGAKVPAEDLARCNRKYVDIIGVFHARWRSQWPMRAATEWQTPAFSNIERIHGMPYRYPSPGASGTPVKLSGC
jgi:hypothetical protein